ncbi:MAG: barstar family protein [Rhodocyclaceae bacterium]|jgi:RNAse (barnase) inhibitor barstar|nr:barstar family protein [Rhodocyclaceae bacterium]
MKAKRLGRLLQNASLAGAYRTPEKSLGDLLAAAAACGFVVRRTKLLGASGKEGLMRSLAAALDFPQWFGHNWDALADCLGDLSWLPAKGYLLILEDAADFCSRHEPECATALQLLGDAADAWRAQRVPFWALADVAPGRLPPLPASE